MSPETFEQFCCLARLLSDARIRSEARAKVTHQRFNVFTTLLSASDEVRLHTRFIHCLLDPQGFHDCGPLFLNLFFETLEELPGVNHGNSPVPIDLPPSMGPWTVEKEAFRPSVGQIDLLLETPGFGIAIENKIYAEEQKDQLARYSAYLKGRFGEPIRVIYLTLDGKPSATHGNTEYLRISYADHILAWLEHCLRETYRIIPINQVLLQYREVVRSLTGKTMDTEVMNSIAEFILKNSDVLRFRQQINQGVEVARAAFMDQLADGITKELQSEFQVRYRTRLKEGRFGLDSNGALIITPSENSPLHGVPFEIWVEHIAKWFGVAVGIEAKYEKPPISAELDLHLKRMNERLDLDAANRKYHKATLTSTWRESYWPTGWHNLLADLSEDEVLADLFKTPMPVTVAKVCADIRNHIELLERVYVETSVVPVPMN